MYAAQLETAVTSVKEERNSMLQSLDGSDTQRFGRAARARRLDGHEGGALSSLRHVSSLRIFRYTGNCQVDSVMQWITTARQPAGA